MLLRFFMLAAVSGVLLTACGRVVEEIPTEFPTPPPAPAVTPISPLKLSTDAALEKEFAEIAADDVEGRVGVMAVDLRSGRSASLNADQHFPMQSVYKLPIAMAVMDKVRRGELDLEERIGVTPDDFVRVGFRSPLRENNPNGGEFTIRELMQRSLVESDGTASDVLLRLAGGVPEVQSFLTHIGIRDMNIGYSEKEISRDWETQYESWATPAASVELLRWLDADANGWRPPNLDEELSGSQIILQLMSESKTGNQRLKGLLPNSYPRTIADKTGTGGVKDRVTSATNDIGIIYTGFEPSPRIAIAVYVADSKAPPGIRHSMIAKMAKAAWDHWVDGLTHSNFANSNTNSNKRPR